jgi:formylglycine-generating enzyme required for sulfatase activity
MKQTLTSHGELRLMSAPTAARMRSWLLALACAMLAWSLPAQAQRVALLVANQAYEVGRLTYPVQDAAVMREALLKIGFRPADVVTVTNADQRSLRRAIQEFGRRAQGAEVAFLYYSGHATQALGQNWLIPIGADIQTEAGYELEAVSAQAALSQMNMARPKVGIVVLDACRDNPAAVTKSGTKGLGRMDSGDRTLLAFATAPNDTAADTGVYARTLAAELQRPGQELLAAFRRTTAEVRRATGGRQVPRVSEVSLDEEVYLAGRGPAPTPSPNPSSNSTGTGANPNPIQSQNPSPNSGTTASRNPGEVLKDCADCPELVVIGTGSFTMGSPAGEEGRNDDGREGPQRTVTIARPFALGRYEVTVGEFKRFVAASNYVTEAERNVGAKGCYVFDDSGNKWDWQEGRSWRSPGFEQTDRHPVVCVSWNDAQAYVQWLGRQTGQTHRLPSEAEWEYAARAGSSSSRPWGDDPKDACRHGNVADQSRSPSGRTWPSKHECNDGYYFTAPVGSYAPNRFGVNDMMGNAWEWVQDVWHENYSGAPSDGSVWSAGGDPVRRVLRGGSWNFDPQILRSAGRIRATSETRNGFTGFRIARTL